MEGLTNQFREYQESAVYITRNKLVIAKMCMTTLVQILNSIVSHLCILGVGTERIWILNSIVPTSKLLHITGCKHRCHHKGEC